MKGRESTAAVREMASAARALEAACIAAGLCLAVAQSTGAHKPPNAPTKQEKPA